MNLNKISKILVTICCCILVSNGLTLAQGQKNMSLGGMGHIDMVYQTDEDQGLQIGLKMAYTSSLDTCGCYRQLKYGGIAMIGYTSEGYAFRVGYGAFYIPSAFNQTIANPNYLVEPNHLTENRVRSVGTIEVDLRWIRIGSMIYANHWNDESSWSSVGLLPTIQVSPKDWFSLGVTYDTPLQALLITGGIRLRLTSSGKGRSVGINPCDPCQLF